MHSVRPQIAEAFDEDESQERNQQLYKLLQEYKVCVLPDPKIITLDKLPQFSIIEGNIKDSKFSSNSGYTR